ncbi:MAG: nucleotidyltransferase family protein [Cypionkella sp.]|nr:nucleotidyltransferase family protein [Cypionkella sp.]
MQPFPLMLFAAGFGTRMAALTADKPKPMVEVAGKPLIDHALALADAAHIKRRVANLHYRGNQVERYLAGQNITFSWEREQILETGGGLRAALPLLGEGPVLTLNSDAVWTGENPLMQLMAAWDESRMDALLLLLPAEKAIGHSGKGDFLWQEQGRLSRANGAEGLIYLGAQIIRPDLLVTIPEAVFSLNRLWDLMIARGRAYGLIHSGGWCDVGQPSSIAKAEALLGSVNV